MYTNKPERIKLNPATVGLVTIKKDVITSPDFLAGKAGNIAAADKVISQVWSDKKTEQLREHLTSCSIFLTVPSTTRLNVIPAQLAQLLSRETGRSWATGDEIFKTSHKIASKNIPRNDRLFQNREFEIKDYESVEILQEFNIVVIDDIITTGGSIRAFVEFLRDQKINTSHIVGLMGDRRFEIDQKTEEKLRGLLKDKNIGIEFESISYLTRTEAGILIRLLNNVRTENAIQKLAKQLHGISRFRVASNFKRTPGSKRNQSSERKNIGNGRNGKRIQTYTSASDTQGCTWQIEFFRAGKSIKKVEVVLPVNLGKKKEQKQLREYSCQIAAIHDFGPVQIKFTRTKKQIILQKEKKLDQAR